MKFIGQHIWDYISRFRNDVYLESIADGTVANDKFLGLDSNNKIVKEAISVGDANQTIQMGVSDSSPSNFTSIGFGTGNVNLTFEAGEGIDLSTSISPAAKITIAGEEASTSNKGIAEFSGDHFSVSSGKVNLADTITGDKTIQGDLRIGGSGDTSDNWISIDAQNGDDSSGGGITFYETGTYSTSAPQYGAKIVYNEDDDEFAIGTIHNNTFMRQLHMDRGSSSVRMTNAVIATTSTDGPFLFFQNDDTSITNGQSLCRVIVRNADRGTGTTTSQIQWFATEDHDSDSGGTKINFTVTPNGNSQSETTAMTIDQDSSVAIAGNLIMGSTTALNNSGVLQVGAQTNITSLGTLTSGLNIGSASYTGDGVTVQGSDSDNTYDVFVGRRKFPRIRLIDDAATGDTEFSIWNLGDELRIGTNPGSHSNAAVVIHTGNAGLVEVQDDIQVNGEIQLGSASDTTIARSSAGTVTIEGKEILTNDSGTVTVSAGTSGDATLIIEADTDNNNEDDLPRLWFRADAINEGAIQLQDNTLDIINNVSANGGIRFLTGTTNNTGTTDPSTSATERMSISSTGAVTINGSLNLGHASDTTISRAAAGIVMIENDLVVTTTRSLVTSSGSTNQPVADLLSRRTLTTAEMNDLHNTPIQVAPAPGNPNQVAIVTGGMIRVDRASTNSGTGSLDFHYNGVTASYGTTSLIHFRRFHAGRTTDGVYNIVPNSGGVLTSTNLTDHVDSAIEVSLTSACTTNCFTSVDIFLTYKVITIA